MPMNANRAITLRDAERLVLVPIYSCAHETATINRFAWLAPDDCDDCPIVSAEVSTHGSSNGGRLESTP